MKKNIGLILLSVLLLASCSESADEEQPSYTVYHYLENIDDDEYTLDSTLTQKVQARLNDQTTAEALPLEGFIPQDFEQITVGKKNNSVSIYYKRIVSTLTFNGNGGTITQTNDEGEEETLEQVVITGKYGAAIEAPEFTRSTFVFKGWDKELPESIPASDLELTGLWKAEITNNTYRFVVRPVQKFINMKGEELTQKLCWDYRSGLNLGNQLIIWLQKNLSNADSNNQIFSFEPVEGKENTYYIFSNKSGTVYYLAETTKDYTAYDSTAKTSTTVSIDGLGAAVKSTSSLQFELIPVASPEKPYEEIYALKIAGTERYVTTGYSMYNYSANPVYLTGTAGYEPLLTFDTLRTDENGNIEDPQLFYLDNVE